MKKKKYESPDIEVYFAYDLDTELMYGGNFSGGGGTSGLITGSNPSVTPPNILDDEWDDGENGGSDR